MINSIPISALRLGIGFDEYEKVARNIARVSLIPPRARQEIVKRADGELAPKIIDLINELVMNIAYDRAVFKIAGLKYWRGPPPGENLFSTAVADYLLTVRYFQ